MLRAPWFCLLQKIEIIYNRELWEIKAAYVEMNIEET